MEILALIAYYANGRWGTNCASVRGLQDGSAWFCNGFADPMVYPSWVAAEEAFYRFLADKRPADAMAIQIEERWA